MFHVTFTIKLKKITIYNKLLCCGVKPSYEKMKKI